MIFFSVTTEALFAWILLFGTGCFWYSPKQVFVSSQKDIYFFDKEDEKNYYIPVKRREFNPSIMTCNCSWGKVVSGLMLFTNFIKLMTIGGLKVQIKFIGLKVHTNLFSLCHHLCLKPLCMLHR